MKKYILVAFNVLFFLSLNAQVKGVVFGSNKKEKEPIFGAKVFLKNSRTGDITNAEGEFEFILPKTLPDTMIVSAIGYYPDTIIVTKKDRFITFDITLYSDQLLEEMIVKAKRDDRSVLRLKTLQVENISSGELRKAACCNLSESFETNASVDVNITDAVSGAKKIQMMGLDGVYTQLQFENIPYLRGLESSFGLNSIPGTWIESIQITKGTGNVVNGYESMAGLVNFEVKKPEEMERIFLNGYANRFGRSELNFNSGFHLNEKWTSGWFVHGSVVPVKIDENGDGFRDLPNGSNVAILNRYNYEGKKMEAQFGFNAYLDNKIGGQVGFDVSNPLAAYGVVIDSRHIDVFGKTGFFLKRPLHSIGVVYDAKYQTVDARFGARTFTGSEQRGYINAIYDGIIGSTLHKFKVGAGGVYAKIEQDMGTLRDNREEIVPGVFGEYSYSGRRLSLVAGIRQDYHNLFGFQFSPRLHTKYAVNEHLDVRATAGRGWRVPNYQIDNISLLACSRQWIAPNETLPEISWNFGGSIVQRFKFLKRKSSLTLDYYRTNFENQLIVDHDQSTSFIIFDNLQGTSFSNSFQAELGIEPLKNFEMRFAYKYLDVRSDFGGILQQKVMVPKHRGLINLSYTTPKENWEFDLTTALRGKARLPQVILPDGSLTERNESEAYYLINAQVTYNLKKWEFYVGGENLLNYVQQNPIVDAENPWSPSFNAIRIWAPVVGANVYVGFRFSIDQKQNDEKEESRHFYDHDDHISHEGHNH